MTVEVADFVGDLDQTLPTDDNDFVFEGDDHFRLVKKTLVQSFAAILGAVTVTHTELNALDGITGNVETRLDALEALVPEFAATTVMLFAQAAAPDGWTVDATNDDRLIRVDGVAGGTTAGTWTISGLSSGSTDIAHTHGVSGTTAGAGNQGSLKDGNNDQVNIPGHTHTFSVTSGSGGGSHSHTVTQDGNWRPEYLDVIVCVKD